MALNVSQFGLGILVTAKDMASATLTKIGKNVKQTSGDIETASKRAEVAGKNLRMGVVAMGAGVAVLAPLAFAVKQASDFEDQLANTMTMTGLTGEAYTKMAKGMSDYALELSGTLGIAGKDIVGSFYQVLSSGAEALSSDFKGLAEAGAMMAKLIGIESTVAIEALSDSLGAFAMPLSRAGEMADAFFVASRLGATTVPQLTEAMRAAAPVAGALGISLGDTTAILTSWAAKGIKGSEAGTAFKTVMVRLMDTMGESRKGFELLEEITGKTVERFTETGAPRKMIDVLIDLQKATRKVTAEEKLSILTKIGGLEMGSRLMALLDTNLDLTKDWSREIERGGAIQEAFNKKQQIASEQWNLVKINMQNAAIALGNQLLPALTELAKMIVPLVKSIAEFLKAHPTLTKTIVIITAITGVVLILGGAFLMAKAAFLMVVPAIVGGLKAIGIAFATNPIGLIIMAIVAVIYLLYKAWSTNFLGIRDITASIVGSIRELIKSLISKIKAAWEWIKKIAGYTPAGLLVKGVKFVGEKIAGGRTEKRQAGGLITKAGFVGSLDKGEVIVRAPAVRRIERMTELIERREAAAPRVGVGAAGPRITLGEGAVQINFPGVREVSEIDVEVLAARLFTSIQERGARLSERAFETEFAPRVA